MFLKFCTPSFRWIAALVLFGFAAPATAQNTSLIQKPEVAGALQVLDSWIEATRVEHQDPGLSIGVVYDQDLVWSKGYGFADLEKRKPATSSTVYRLASLSKLFTATAIVQLRDAGKLELDDPVQKYLPWFRVKQPPNSIPITIRQLLTHTSGLARDLDTPMWNELKFPSREEMIRLIPEQPAVFPPDTEYKYSNLAVAIAGEIVATVSGEPYERYVREHILDPLGMQATLVTPSPSTPELAVGYRKRVPGQPRVPEDFINFGGYTPAAGFASSVNDLAKFVELQFRDGNVGGSQILRGSSLKEMQRTQWMRPDWQNGEGLIFELRRVGQLVYVAKGGTCPGYRSEIEMLPSQKLGVIVLANGYDTDVLAYASEILRTLGPVIAKAVEKPKPQPVADPSWSNFVGTYTWKHADAEILIIDGQLTMMVPDAANPWESRVTLTPVGRDTFKQHGGPNDGELLKFDVDASGRATRFWSGTYYRVRKEMADDQASR
jgi:CubicO group peptidase (beta-lactamase class C family)